MLVGCSGRISLAGACEDLVGTVSFWASTEIDLSEGVSFRLENREDLSGVLGSFQGIQ